MTEQLFKAYDNDKKEWIDDFYIDIYGNVFDFGIDDRLDIVLVSDPINATLVRATGLKDKHGRMIFEGDIVKGSRWLDNRDPEKQKISFIVYKQSGFWVDEESFGYEGEDLWSWQNIEVIGNKWDNPELLEEMK